MSHDAGGAEILSSYVAQNKVNFKLVLEGPAINVFKRRLGVIDISPLEKAISDCDWCLCGTGWQSDLEWRAIEQAHKAGKRVVAFLDHWVNYQERFIRNGIQHLPDEIWVGDEDAEKLAQKQFPTTLIQLVPNPYFIDIKREIVELEARKNLPDEKGKAALFVCENISDHSRLRYGNERYLGYTEFDAITYFFENIKTIGEPVGKVVIRPHPSDSFGKYNWVLEAYPDIVELSHGKLLIKEIVESDMVIGCNSMAMVVGLLAQKKVISSIPPCGKACRLPQAGIEHLQVLVSDYQRSPHD